MSSSKTNYQSFKGRLEKLTTKEDVENLMDRMCFLYDLGLLTSQELIRMDRKAVDYLIKTIGALV